jgi:uncharacterized protein YjbJ (UPF0337 family)
MSAGKDKLKGTIMQVEGKLTDDPIRTAEGTLEKTKGNVEGVLARLRKRLKSAAHRVRAKFAGEAG